MHDMTVGSLHRTCARLDPSTSCHKDDRAPEEAQASQGIHRQLMIDRRKKMSFVVYH